MFAKLKKHAEQVEQATRGIDRQLQRISTCFLDPAGPDADADAALLLDALLRQLEHARAALSGRISDADAALADAERATGDAAAYLHRTRHTLRQIRLHLADFGFRYSPDSHAHDRNESEDINYNETASIEPNDTFNFL